MIRNDVSNETAHVTNWLLYSGCVDLQQVYADAMKAATTTAENDDSEFGESFDDLVIEELAPLLSDALDDALNGVIFDYFHEALSDVIGWQEADYRSADERWLVRSLIGPTFERMSFHAVAELVAEHIKSQVVS